MKKVVLLAALLSLAGCQTRLLEQEGNIRVEPSNQAGSDYVVHLQNLVDFGFNPDDPANRHKWALDYIKGQCPNGRVVGDRSIDTGSFATGRRARTYFVYIACR